jgi:hypothetical protein
MSYGCGVGSQNLRNACADSASHSHLSSTQKRLAGAPIVAGGAFRKITSQKETGLTNIVDGTMVMVYDS